MIGVSGARCAEGCLENGGWCGDQLSEIYDEVVCFCPDDRVGRGCQTGQKNGLCQI